MVFSDTIREEASDNIQMPEGPTGKKRGRSGLAYAWWFLRRYPVLPGIILSLLVIAAIFGPSLAPYERDIGAVRDRHLGMGQTSEYSDPPIKSWWPDGYHLFGADHVGRDVFSRLLHGARISMQVVLVSLGIGSVVGISLGMVAGYMAGEQTFYRYNPTVILGILLSGIWIVLLGLITWILMPIIALLIENIGFGTFDQNVQVTNPFSSFSENLAKLGRGTATEGTISIPIISYLIFLIGGTLILGGAVLLLIDRFVNTGPLRRRFKLWFLGGGFIDGLITRFVDIWYAMPFLMVALIVVLIFGRGLNVLLFVLALISWTSFVRVVRAQVMVLKELDYVDAAKVCGASHFRILYKHLLPGIFNIAIVVGTLSTSGLILSEAVLSFVGAGIQPPKPAWGVMTNEGRDYLTIAPHQVLVPSLAIFLVCLSLNFLGDWLRDRLDPRMRQIE